MGAPDGAAYRQTYSRPPDCDRAKYAGCRRRDRGEFCLRSGPAGWPDYGRFQSRGLLRTARWPPEIKFDWSKFIWIGSPEKNDVVHFIRADSPFKSIDDLRNAKEPPKCGSTGPGTTAHYFPRLLEDTLGIKTTVVTGYQGGSEIDLAIERNEVICWSPLSGTYFGREPYKRWHKSGFIRAVVQTGAKRDERLKDTPTLTELMQQYKTPEAGRRLAKVVLTATTLGRPVAAPPRLSGERTKILRDSYAKTMNDPELLAEAAKRGWDVDPLTGADLESLAKDVIVQPKEVIERMKWVLGN